jgi:hypothetical protein
LKYESPAVSNASRKVTRIASTVAGNGLTGLDRFARGPVHRRAGDIQLGKLIDEGQEV